LLNKNKFQLKHIIIKAVQCTLLSIYVCYYICCKSCLTLNILTTVKSYDDLLRKVNIDHFVCQIGLLKTISKQSLTLKSPWGRCVRAVKTLCARCEHAEATACALWKRHGRCKYAVGTSCGRCRDTVRTLCTRYNWQIWYV